MWLSRCCDTMACCLRCHPLRDGTCLAAAAVPKVYLTVLHRDSWGRETVQGYGYLSLPGGGGSRVEVVRCIEQCRSSALVVLDLLCSIHPPHVPLLCVRFGRGARRATSHSACKSTSSAARFSFVMLTLPPNRPISRFAHGHTSVTHAVAHAQHSRVVVRTDCQQGKVLNKFGFRTITSGEIAIRVNTVVQRRFVPWVVECSTPRRAVPNGCSRMSAPVCGLLRRPPSKKTSDIGTNVSAFIRSVLGARGRERREAARTMERVGIPTPRALFACVLLRVLLCCCAGFCCFVVFLFFAAMRIWSCFDVCWGGWVTCSCVACRSRWWWPPPAQW